MSDKAINIETTINSSAERVFEILNTPEDYGQFLDYFIIPTKKTPKDWIEPLPSDDGILKYYVFMLHPLFRFKQAFGYVKFNINPEEKKIRWATFANPKSSKDLPWYQRTAIMWLPILIISVILFWSVIVPILAFVTFINIWKFERRHTNGHGLSHEEYGTFIVEKINEKETRLKIERYFEMNVMIKAYLMLFSFPLVLIIAVINLILRIVTAIINLIFKTTHQWQIQNIFSEKAQKEREKEGLVRLSEQIKRHAEFYS